MAQARNVRAVGSQIEVLLAELGSVSDPQVQAKSEELVRLLVELYGAGLERMVELVGADESGGPAMLQRLAGDELVASLLVLHGLHPVAVDERVHQALERVRPYLGSHAGGVQFLGIDEAGVAHLKLEGSCDGCPSSTVTVKLAIERAIEEAAPELNGIEVEGVAAERGPKLLQIRTLAGAEPDDAAGEPSWTTLPGLDGLGAGQLTVVQLDGLGVLVCATDTGPYAYRNACAACGAGLGAASLDGHVLACPACAARFDVRLAGRGVERGELHLDPLPLLTDGGRVRVAVPAGVGP
jgi:Fe-S cluster biogenesis protein NfuA/nitrite reductase/ring-hydroxylating ferredoxin subunit